MTIVIFIVVLGVLILSHEFGHFIVAKKFGIKVEEFGLGFPPRLFGWQRGETTYSLNVIPFGGFVKIFGENPDEESISGLESSRSIVKKSKLTQAAVLGAGIVFNLILAWFLVSFAFATVGLPTQKGDVPAGEKLLDPRVVITGLVADSPASATALAPGDLIVKIENGVTKENPTLAEIQELSAAGSPFGLTYRRGAEVDTLEIKPERLEGYDSPMIGIQMVEIGTLRVGPIKAVIMGLKTTANWTQAIAVALAGFLADIFRGEEGVLDQVTGPVGLANLVGDASQMGLGYLMLFTAIISIHLALLNLIPFPALDGGRLLFLLIESIKGSPIKPKIANAVNLAGFALLILLMIVVTVADIRKMF